jgi:N-acetylglucosamine-6-phosphate deacetylase
MYGCHKERSIISSGPPVLYILFYGVYFCYDFHEMTVIDVHIHGIGGFGTRDATPEDILNVAEIMASHGVSAIVPTIYSAPIEAMRSDMAAVRGAMEARSGKGSAILGVHLEGPFLNPVCGGALEPSSFLGPGERLYRGLIEGFEDTIRIITISPELDGALTLIRLACDAGIVVSMGHSNATFAEAEAGFQHGARGITHLFNGMRAFHHREPGIAGFGLLNPHVYVELIADPYHLHRDTIDLVFKVKAPSRVIIVSDSVKQTADAVTTKEAVRDPSGRLQGGAVTVTEACRSLIEAGFDPEAVFRCVGSNPEAYLGL